MLPLSLLKSAINHPMLVELKNGETYNGHLASCDAWMNILLTQVICTSRDGDRFWKMPECYIRGSTIKYLRISDEVVDNYKEDNTNRMYSKSGNQSGGGGRGGSRGGGQNQVGGGNRNNQNNGNSNRGGSGGGQMGRGGSNANRGGRQNQNQNRSSNYGNGGTSAKQQRK